MKKRGAGKLRHTCEVQRLNAGATNAYNEAADGTTTVFAGLSCEVSALRGRDLENARQLKTTITHRVRWRSLSSVKPEDWFVPSFDKTKKLYVEALTHDERQMWYEALCTERLN